MRAAEVRRILLPAVAAGCFLLLGPAARAEENDLREFRVGESVAELPSRGYEGFACATDPKHTLSGWSDWRACPAGPDGLRGVRFRYDESANPLAGLNDRYQGTKVGGHPVLLTLLIADDRVQGLRIETDPSARLYLRKKAFLFGDQVKARFGAEGWSCTEAPPAPGEEPVGGVFLKERCEKTTPTRRFVMERELYRRAGTELKDFVSNTRVTILAAGESPPAATRTQ